MSTETTPDETTETTEAPSDGTRPDTTLPSQASEPTVTEPSRGSVITAEQDLMEAADADPWHKFATSTVDHHEDPSERGRWGLVRARAWLVARHEWTIAAVVSVLAAVAMTWPALADPTHTVPHDAGDPLVSAYLIGWGGHALFTDPLNLFNLNAFYGETLSFAFGDTLLGFAPAGIIGEGQAAALLRYNILYVLSIALVVFGAYVLLRQLGSRLPGAVFGAAAIAFAPWRMAQAGHLQVIAVGGILLSLAMLAKGHGWSMRNGYRPRRTRWGWVAAGWGVATWQITLSFGMGVPFGYLLAGIVVVAAIGWLLAKRPRIPKWVLLTDGIGAFVFAGAAVGLSIPYFRVVDQYPYAATDLDLADRFSPSWLSFITAPAESWIWGGLHAPARDAMYWPAETTLLVGFALLGLGLAGFVYSSWTRRQRWWLAIGLVVSVVLTMGTNFLDDGDWAYGALHRFLPGFGALRVSGRLVLYVTIVLAILAAGTITRLGDRLHDMAVERRIDPREPVHRPILARLALFLPVALVVLEGISVAAHPTVPTAPAALISAQGPMLVLPASRADDAQTMLWSTQGFPQLANGTATFVPRTQDRIFDVAVSFPQANAVSALRALGVKTVVVQRNKIAGTSWQHVLDFPPTDPSVSVNDLGEVVVFTIG
ncbi:hypothetical protein [Phytomonospora endophytica]|uniref:4-amino-4-deoxy-L-arabinose transferase-like glycosyltransferase n=1 Tax=Phytomonospora endophytica TaxID=714109 RepID=A0A841FU52_9ACTN|nr:hypothetical protein [Phytomonospora endophytica]MBB6039875.1 hypothetical protein [Phytomonospora endophytica]GIG71055.1 hypothetical protein Pen01_73500 [Phytomonospora endophytica]